MRSPEVSSIDHLVITAGTENQAEGFRAQLDMRRRDGRLSAELQTHVVCDPPGKRSGSGGSTLMAFHHLAAVLPFAGTIPETFGGKQILLLHAGGLSTRLPAYAAVGKLFTPLPCSTPSGRPADLFDLLLANLKKIPRPATGHVLVASGDVLLTFDPSEIDLARPGVTGICYPDTVDRAARHGVYVVGSDGRVRRFLQKPTLDQLAEQGALDAFGRASVDTGLMSWSPVAVEAICRAAGLIVTDGELALLPGLLQAIESGLIGDIDLYEEIALALAADATEAEYERQVLALPKNADPQKKKLLRALHRALREIPFHAAVLSYCDFFHLGTSRELLAGLVGRSRTGASYSFRNFTRAIVPDALREGEPFVFNSVIASDDAGGGAALIEGSYIRGPLALAGKNLVNGVPGEAEFAVRLPEGVSLLMLPVGKKQDWTALVYGVDDDFQSDLGQAGCTFLNQPIEEFLARNSISPKALWPNGPETLYYARLWRRGNPDSTWTSIQWVLDANPSRELKSRWENEDRVSLADLLSDVDHDRLLDHRANLERLVSLLCPFDQISGCLDFDSPHFVTLLRSQTETAGAMEDLSAGLLATRDPLLRARVLILGKLLVERAESMPADRTSRCRIEQAAAEMIGDQSNSADFSQAAQAAVRETVGWHVALPRSKEEAHIEPDQVIWATAPARLDFAGGWSDTPPICVDRGGTVINAAVTLNGQYPIQAIVKLNEDYTLNLTSIDLGRRLTVERIEELRAYGDPADWASLPKACCCLAGLIGEQTSGDVRPMFRAFGGGLDLTLFSALPKGSGLGASSILGATVLAALARLTGATLPSDQLILRTSLLEQMMTTGGGWQDQAGGVFPGVKLIRTQPGLEQIPAVFWLAFDLPSIRPQMLLYYTGYKRLAKNILQSVVEHYLARDPHLIATIEQLKTGALELRTCIDARDLEGFGRGIAKYWELKKCIDPGASTLALDDLMGRCQSRCLGSTLLGAGGGGFLLMVARSVEDARLIRNEFSASPGAPGARFFDFDIDAHGLKVSVL